MKKIVVLAVVLAVSSVGLLVNAQTEEGRLPNQNDCAVYTAKWGKSTAGCGGAENVCCANTNLNFS